MSTATWPTVPSSNFQTCRPTVTHTPAQSSTQLQSVERRHYLWWEATTKGNFHQAQQKSFWKTRPPTLASQRNGPTKIRYLGARSSSGPRQSPWKPGMFSSSEEWTWPVARSVTRFSCSLTRLDFGMTTLGIWQCLELIIQLLLYPIFRNFALHSNRNCCDR